MSDEIEKLKAELRYNKERSTARYVALVDIEIALGASMTETDLRVTIDNVMVKLQRDLNELRSEYHSTM